MAASRTVTARAAVLAVAIASVVLALALPLKVFLGQRAQIARLHAAAAASAAHIAALQAQIRQWHDPGFIEMQAGEQLHFVRPGETSYLILGGPAATGATAATRSGATPAATATAPWYSELWATATAAAAAPTRSTPASGTRTAPPSGRR